MSRKKRKRPFNKKVSPGGHFSQVEQRLSLKKMAIWLLVAAAISSAAAAIVLHFSGPAKAALADHLSLTFPNQGFIDTATEILQEAGYEVDYYPGEEVTVEFYKNLPTRGYRLIILRVHSSVAGVLERGVVKSSVALFTSQRYNEMEYVDEQLTGRLGLSRYSTLDSWGYFGIAPEFVTDDMEGRFQNTTVIVMGCQGLSNTKMAEAFIEKGAKAYIGWDQGVLASHTDRATIQLLDHLVLENQTIEQAVENTMKEVGPDPICNSTLLYYPP